MASKKKGSGSKKKGARINVMLKSTGKTKAGKPTGFYMTTSVNTRTQQTEQKAKLELMKFDPKAWNAVKNGLGMRVKFKQAKLPK